MGENFLKKILIISLLLNSYTSHAQLFDTIVASFNHKPKLVFKFDTRNSFITSQKAKIFGIKLGLNYNETVKLGIGFNSLLTDIYADKQIKYGTNEIDTVKARLHFFYVSPYFEYVFYRNKKWEHSIPIQIGFGNSGYKYRNRAGILIKENYQPVILYEPSMTTQYKFLSWAAIGLGLGYRVMVLKNRDTDVNFNSPIYVLKLNLFPGNLYKAIFPKKQK